ncbi:MAG: D-amino acid aminotransferase [Thiotrichales bacterium]
MAESLPVVYLNGAFGDLATARVSVLDRGFLFADGVYEVVPVYRGRPFQLAAHLKRLRRSLTEIGMADPREEIEWLQIVRRIIRDNGGGDLALYIQVTRGAAPRDHGFPPDSAPTVLVMASALQPQPEAVLQEGIAAIVQDDPRWGRCDIKSIALLANVLARQAALDAGARETIFVRGGYLTEAAVANVFVVSSGEVLTPPLGPAILAGVTRAVVLELCRAHDIRVRETKVSQNTLKHADEIWISSSIRGVLAVTRIDGRAVGDGKPGPVWTRVRSLYESLLQRVASARPAAPRTPAADSPPPT